LNVFGLQTLVELVVHCSFETLVGSSFLGSCKPAKDKKVFVVVRQVHTRPARIGQNSLVTAANRSTCLLRLCD
jgi:hypothetical protein